MLDVLKHVYNACDPNKPATEEFYLDCSAARGSSALTQRFLAHLRYANGPCCFLFSGHIGCGKSSELAELRRVLERSQPSPPNARYFPVLLDANDYLDVYDVEPFDVLLAIATEIAAALRVGLRYELKDNYFFKRLDELKDFLLRDTDISEVEVGSGAGSVEVFGVKLPVPTLKTRVQLLKKDPTERQKVRDALRARTSTMLEEINLILDEARLAVKKAPVAPGETPYSDLVLILDNLEKIELLENAPDGLAAQEELFLRRYSQFTGIKANIIYTVPLRLARASAPELKLLYGASPFVLPMVKVIERGGQRPYGAGVERLRELLQRRMGEVPLDDVFTPEALDFLLKYSGGSIRSLMSFVREAVTYTDGTPIGLPAARLAIRQTVRDYSTSIPEAHWAELARLDLSSDQKIPNDNADYLAMLESLSVLEYLNGGDEENPFGLAEPWYAVNPIVRELQKFKSAKADLLSNISAEPRT